MNFLLDTCVLLWFLEGNKGKLGPFMDLIEDSENDIVISVVTYWEIAIKSKLGKLKLPSNWFEAIDNGEFYWLNLEPKHIKHLEMLPLLHNDSFDRLLIAQSFVEQRKLLTSDSKILLYF